MLKFARDRQRWLRWLFESKKRFGTRILNYTVTSNHIHLLVQDDGRRDILPKTIQLTAGRKFFVEKVKNDLGFKAIGRKVVSTGDVYELKESKASYSSDFDGKMSTLRPENSIQWHVYNDNSI